MLTMIVESVACAHYSLWCDLIVVEQHHIAHGLECRTWIDEILEQARREGYEKGLAEGRMEIATQQLDLVDQSVKYMESVEDKMADIVLKALRKCIDGIDGEELVMGVTRKAMKAIVRTQRQITIRTSPKMAPVVKARTAELTSEFPSLDYVEVVEDGKLDDSSCVIETAAGTVDASVEGQLAAIEKSIRKNFTRD